MGSKEALPGPGCSAWPRGTLLGVKDSPAHSPCQPGPRGAPHPPTPASARTSPLCLSSHLVRVQFHSAAHERHVPLRGGRTPTGNSEPTLFWALGSAQRGWRRNQAAPSDRTELSPPPAPRYPLRTQYPSGCQANAPPPRLIAPPRHAAPLESSQPGSVGRSHPQSQRVLGKRTSGVLASLEDWQEPGALTRTRRPDNPRSWLRSLCG